MTRSTETGNEHFIVLITETHTTISGDVACNSLVVFLELNSDTLTDGRVRLLGLNTNLLDNNASGVRGALEGFLPGGTRVGFLVGFVGPSILKQIISHCYCNSISPRLVYLLVQSSLDSELATSVDSSRFSTSHIE